MASSDGSKAALLAQHLANFMIECRYFGLHDIPNNLCIETEVLMNQDISKAGYFLPIRHRVLLAKLRGEFLDGLTNDFKIPNDRVERLLVFKERRFSKADGIRRDLSRGLENILQVDARIPRHTRFLVG